MDQVVVSATVVVDNTEQEKILRASEAFSRAAAGLALDGISVQLTLGIVKDDDL